MVDKMKDSKHLALILCAGVGLGSRGERRAPGRSRSSGQCCVFVQSASSCKFDGDDSDLGRGGLGKEDDVDSVE